MGRLELKRRRWREHVEGWRRSGLNQAEYCRRHGLNAKRFRYWARQEDGGAQPLTLVPVRLRERAPPLGPAAPAAPLVLQNANGWQMMLPSTVSADWLADVLRGLS